MDEQNFFLDRYVISSVPEGFVLNKTNGQKYQGPQNISAWATEISVGFTT